jgi:DNA polymerase zeta
MLFPQTIALNLEPESGIYHDPVAVLDFQSLYPSICIAYNYCFSTCLGRLSNYASLLKRLEGDEIPDDFDLPLMTIGALPYQIESVQRLKELIDSKLVSISPTGGIFVDKSVRLGLLGTMLTKLLDTRVMVKQAMKNYKNIEVCF